MTTIKHNNNNRLLRIPLKYFDKTKLLYYPPALVPGTVILQYFPPSSVISTIKRRKNETEIQQQEEENKIFAHELLTRLCRRFHISGKYVYDYTPKSNTTLDSVKFIFYENFNKRTSSSVENVINNTNYIIGATFFQVHREEETTKINKERKERERKKGGRGREERGGGRGGRRGGMDGNDGNEEKTRKGNNDIITTTSKQMLTRRRFLVQDGGGDDIKIDRCTNEKFSWRYPHHHHSSRW